MTRTIEDIILDHDRRGINALRPHVPADFCTQAARYALVHSGPVIIATGFYIMMSDAPETDGPPGAFAIGNALRELGNPVMYAADEPVAYMMASWVTSRRDPSPIIRFPIIDDPNINEHFVQETITERDPALLISIERCSRDAGGVYRNMRGRDITPQTARVDRLFECGLPSIGIGDGGNEIGMGNLAEVIAHRRPVARPSGGGRLRPAHHIQHVKLGRVRVGGCAVTGGGPQPAPRRGHGRRLHPFPGGRRSRQRGQRRARLPGGRIHPGRKRRRAE